MFANPLSAAFGTQHPPPMVGIEPQGAPIDLHEGQHITLRDAVGTIARTIYGSVWITEEGNSQDILLRTGERFTIDRPGLTVITALARTRVCLQNAAAH